MFANRKRAALPFRVATGVVRTVSYVRETAERLDIGTPVHHVDRRFLSAGAYCL